MKKGLFLVWCLSGVAAGYAASGPLIAGKIIDTVVCKADASQSYALYIPVKHDKAPVTIVYCFDPHGSGVLPLRKYKALADAYGFVLVGSNNSKNGNDWNKTDNIWSCLWADTQNRLGMKPGRVYTCGFSGGAKVAGYLALGHTVIKGVIANGAALPDGTPAGDFPFSFTAIAGEGDLNLTDIVAASNALDKTRTRHHLLRFDGKHEWATPACMRTAFAGLQLDAMRQGLMPRDEAFINRFAETGKSRVEAYAQSNQWLKAGDECGLSLSYIDGLTPQAAWFKEKAAALARNPQYQQQQRAQAQLLQTEESAKARYMQRLQQADMPYWTNTVHDLQKRARAKTAESPMCQRLLAWLSLVCYSYSNHFISSNANNEAGYFVELYKLVDYSNSEAWYFSAILHARIRQPQATEGDLVKAAGYGFNDNARLEQQPEFRQLWDAAHLSAVEGRMRAQAMHVAAHP